VQRELNRALGEKPGRAREAGARDRRGEARHLLQGGGGPLPGRAHHSYILVFMVAAGSMHIAIDGDHRGEGAEYLETLLATSTPRSDLVLGRMLAVIAVALTAGLVESSDSGSTSPCWRA